MKFILLGFLLLSFINCSPKSHDSYVKKSPAGVEKQTDGGPSIITLTPAAENRLALQTFLLRPAARETQIPNSAILYDNNGGTWVFEKNEGRKYHRVPVQLHRIDGDSAWILSSGIKNMLIVVSGVSELFGTEAGVGK